jgi:glycerate 2-kinase
MQWSEDRVRAVLSAIFEAAVARADPRRVVAAALPTPPAGRTVVVGAGKAAASMAASVEAAWPNRQLAGLVVTPYGHAVATKWIGVVEAAHPVPDENGVRAAARILESVRGLGPDDLVIALLSGGGSSVLTLPAPGITLADKQAVNRELLRSGATIHEMNAIRKHLSAIKGGRLAQAARPARVATLAISDVPGDDPSVIASGPTVGDASTLAEVREIVGRYGIALPPSVVAYLATAPETPKPWEVDGEVRLVATPGAALAAAAQAARGLGLQPLVLGELEGESRDLGIVMAGIARSVRTRGVPIEPPAVLLSGGETTVTIRNAAPGRGGRNMEFLLSLAIALDAAADVWAMACDTDGKDGTEDAAGAIVAPDTLARARGYGFDPRAALEFHDSFPLFDALGDVVRTGPTYTNVGGFRAVAIL